MLRMTETEIGKRYEICALDLSGNMKTRLMELGIIEGTAVKRTKNAPFGGMAAFLVHGAEIALRSDCARKITVREI